MTHAFTEATRPFGFFPQDPQPQGVFIRPDGLILYVTGAADDEVYRFDLSTPNDLTSAGYTGVVRSVQAQETFFSGLHFRPDGTEMYAIGGGTDTVYRYDLD